MLSAPRSLCLLLALAHSVAFGQELRQTPLPQGHPLIGVWRIDLPNGCFEEYAIRADGTKLSESGAERNESIFQISDRPSATGYYRWVDQITKGNGQPDCGGATTEVGHVAVNFIRLHPTSIKFLLCKAEEMNSCFAEFYRKQRAMPRWSVKRTYGTPLTSTLGIENTIGFPYVASLR